MTRFLPSLFGSSDEQMMWRVKMEDDSQAFATLVARWEKPLMRLCTRLTGDLHRAEDLVQVVFTRVFSGRSTWEPKAKFSTFIWRIALNLCHDEARRKSRSREFSIEGLEQVDAPRMEAVDGESPAPDVQAESRERGDLVREALLQLAPHYREVVVLRHYEQLKFCEIAALLGIPEGTVKSRMAEALTQLNRRLNPLREELLCNQRNERMEGRAP